MNTLMNFAKRGFATLLLTCMPVLAFAAGGGLDEATDAIDEFQTWLYAFMGVGVLVYMIYQIGMAMMEKISWSDVAMAVGKVAAAGGSVILATWAWSIWGS